MKKFVISIGRQIGSGGKEIAEKLAGKLNIKYYDKTLLDVAARESGIDPEIFANADERESNHFLGGLFSIHGSMADYMPGGSYIQNDKLFQIQSEAIRNLADEENCIIVGRCAEYILRDHPCMTSIFVTADKSERIGRIMAIKGLEQEKAAEYIEKEDKKRRNYHDYYASTRWGEARSYDLCINSSLLGIDGTVEFLHSFIQSRIKG